MKKLIVIFGFIGLFSLSGCFIIETNGAKRGGPPWWAPAHGYRKKHSTTIYYSKPNVIIITKGKGNGGRKH